MLLVIAPIAGANHFPGEHWESRTPEEMGMDGAALDALAESLGGRGCVVKDGYVVKAWGDQAERSDWLSSAKPVLSTLLFFAIQEGKVEKVDQPIAEFGWPLEGKDRGITFRHLGAMSSGYARPDGPGEAWAYNDFAIQLYQKTLFDKVFSGDPDMAAADPNRFGALQLEDGLDFTDDKRRLKASVRDFARIAWFWLNHGTWGDRQVLPARFFDEFMKPQTPLDLPHTQEAGDNDYLGIGSYGGGSDHFTKFGAGIYGFNWWFNGAGRLHPEALTWPDAPADTIMSIGAGGNCSVIVPSLNLLLAAAKANWGRLDAGNPKSETNRHIASLVGVIRSNVAAMETAAENDKNPEGVTVLDDGFDALSPGNLFGVVGAHAEYHYVSETEPKAGWSVSAFTSSPASQLAWKVIREDGDTALAQTYRNKAKHTHPLVTTGDRFWQDYDVSVRFAPDDPEGRSGVAFRMHNDRCYYFFGVDGQRAVLMRVKDATAFRQPWEVTLAEKPFEWNPGDYVNATVSVQGARIRASIDETVSLTAEDDTFARGGIGLLSDARARYSHVKVTMSQTSLDAMNAEKASRVAEEEQLQADHPKPVLWKKIKTTDFGVGRNLRFGDLDGDGEIDVLIGQVMNHGPKDRNSELSCLTAMTFDGEMLWQIGEQDPWKDNLTSDVGFQIHDLDGDGANEVIYCMNMEIIVADGATGETKYKQPTPLMPEATPEPYNKFPRILGDSIYFCDLRGTGRASDLIIKDRYRSFWALNDRLETLWSGTCNTGHYPYAYDIDGDGRQELAIGYSLYAPDGQVLWSLDDTLKDHADGVAIIRFLGETDPPRLLCAASDEGIFFSDMQGTVLKHHYLGHVQNPAVANFRDDLPGLETVSINFWGNQGIIHYFDAEGEVYYDFEPVQHGSMCLPINWTGRGEELFVLSPNVDFGGMYDGLGRRAVRFPADGHPDMCNAVLDITGDCRDEVVVWDSYEIWVYTQDDGPASGRLFKPVRNPLYNYSNYQATVSLPGWNDD
jgi:CubicO group peptidase (beta-lactamase class C family)